MPVRRYAGWLLRVSSAAIAIGCGGGDGGVGPNSGPPILSNSPVYQVLRTDSAVWVSPSVIVKDATGAPIEGSEVTFAVTAGGGAVSGGKVTTNASGIATVGGWTVGSAAAVNKLSATVRGRAPMMFTAVATKPTTGLTDPMAGFAEYSGTYPAPVDISYSSGGLTQSAAAYPGQLELFFTAATGETAANQLLRAKGAVILAQAPIPGHYVVAIEAGTEAAAIAALQADARVLSVQPNFATNYGWGNRAPWSTTLAALPAPGIWVIDDCGGPHGTSVTKTVPAAGGTLGGCLSDRGATAGTAALGQTIQHLLKIGAAPPSAGVGDPGSNRLVNLSTYGGIGSRDYTLMTPADQAVVKRAWQGTFRNFLLAISSLPASARKNLVVGICAGNNNAPLSPWITEIRSDPRLAAVLKQNVLIVGANDAAYRGASDAPGDADFAKMTDASSNVATQVGCSFATPRALVEIQDVIDATGLSAEDALLATKQAVAANINQELISAEAISKGEDIAAAIATDGSAARNVTGVAFTSVGSTTSAVINPAAASVTMSYTVSGSDGYFDSARLMTNAAGQVSFGIPAGATGVVDQITVTAVLTGVNSKQKYTWP